jgi:hypothetical protein
MADLLRLHVHIVNTQIGPGTLSLTECGSKIGPGTLTDALCLAEQQDIVKAVANTLSLMNGELKKLGDGAASAETLDRMAQIVYAGQTIVAPAAHQLAAGNMTVDQWTTTYGTAAALNTVYANAGKVTPGRFTEKSSM